MVSPSINSNKLPLKFLCSYGGKIVPRHPDGKLRYYGGDTRVLSIDRSISFSELSVKLVEMCGSSMNLRCQLPEEDLDALVSITCDEDLSNIIEEYDLAAKPSSSLKIRAFLLPPKPKSTKKVISPPRPSISSSSSSNTTTSNNDSMSPNSYCSTNVSPRSGSVSWSKYQNGSKLYNETTTHQQTERCIRRTKTAPPMMFPLCHEKVAGRIPQYAYHSHGSNNDHIYLIHHGNHWQ